MADSTITKRALAEALKELMETMPFEKINVAQIAERCGMSRKSFYYHFRDKYDLVNWIFDMETRDLMLRMGSQETYSARIEFLARICDYFYANRSFYRKALRIQGQNSFSEHVREVIRPMIKARVEYLLSGENADDFELDFLTDACCCALERWLKDKDCIPPGELVARIDRVLQRGTAVLSREILDKKERP